MTKSDRIGDRVRELRTAAGMNQQELATLAGVAVSTISRLERGAIDPVWSLVCRLADALGVSVEAFTVEPTTKPQQPKRGRPRREDAG